MPNHEHVLIIAGMHRSGTTLAAHWLHDCGLNIGNELLKSKYEHANPGGLRFEDLDFLRFHTGVLRNGGLDTEGFIDNDTVIVAPSHIDTARHILEARAHLPQWGWKDPRTCLFLNFWLDRLPSAKLLIVYRHYSEVADSLLRRNLNHERLLRRIVYRLRYISIYRSVQHYIRVWSRYNRDALKAIAPHPADVLVLRTRDIIDSSSDILDVINGEWGFNLAHVNTQSIYQQERLHEELSYVDMNDSRLKSAMEEAQSIYAELETWRASSIKRITDFSPETN